MASNSPEDVTTVDNEEQVVSSPPMGFRVIFREFARDKVAMVSLVIMVFIAIAVAFLTFFYFDVSEVTNVSLWDEFLEPMSASSDPARGDTFYLLGTDRAGRDVFGQLIIGAYNSLRIAFFVTIITSIVGVILGIVSAYYAGMVDNIIMRIIDFVMILPFLPIVILFITIVPSYTEITFVLIMSLFLWHGQARFIRGRALTVGRLDFISASKTMGTPSLVIMFREMMPNISSLIIVNITLNFAANIGLETGLTYLGFGLPTGTPSLGTLVSYARNPDILENRPWVWLPAVTFILVLVLCINYVGRTLQRAADAKQRLG